MTYGTEPSNSEALAKHHQLSEMVCIVVGKDQRLAQNSLSLAPWDFGEEIDFLVAHHSLHGL